jgi:hypothetical protein
VRKPLDQGQGSFIAAANIVQTDVQARGREPVSAQGAIVRASATAAGLAGVIVASAVLWISLGFAPSARRDITLLYVGADDCAPCRAWQREDGPTFRSSSEFARVTYREVKSPSILDVLKDEYWPDDLRRYRERIGRGAGVPLWLVVANGEIVEQGFGASHWRSSVLPRIRSLLR